MGIFAKIKNALKKTKDAIAYRLKKLFTGGVLNDEFYEELENILLTSDIGSETTTEILDELRKVIDKKHITDTNSVRVELKNIMHETIRDNLLSTIIQIAGGFDMTVSEFLDSPLFLEDNLKI